MYYVPVPSATPATASDTCALSTCNDGQKNAGETEIDCGDTECCACFVSDVVPVPACDFDQLLSIAKRLDTATPKLSNLKTDNQCDMVAALKACKNIGDEIAAANINVGASCSL